MKTLGLFLISLLPVFLICSYIYYRDREKEPTSLLVKLFLSGILSCFLVLFISNLLEPIFPILFQDESNSNLFGLLLQAFLGVALVEEVCKWIMVYAVSYHSPYFDDLYDMIVYAVFVSLGFAFFENLCYVLDGGMHVGIFRALFAVPGHASNGIFMGYYLGLCKLSSLNGKENLSFKYLILSIVVPTILHGAYDYFLMSGTWLFLIVFFLFIIFLWFYALKRVDRFAAITRKMKYQDEYCPNCGRVVSSNYCPNCGRKNF